MKFEHSPGPWLVSKDAVPDWHVQLTIYSATTGERIATVFCKKENAKLIAAVPEMYEMLTRIQGVADTAASLLHKSCPEEAQLFREDSKAIRELINKIEEV